jgi:hypothetical protein
MELCRSLKTLLGRTEAMRTFRELVHTYESHFTAFLLKILIGEEVCYVRTRGAITCTSNCRKEMAIMISGIELFLLAGLACDDGC